MTELMLKSKPKRHCAAFTLLEMLVVIGIVALLAMLFIPFQATKHPPEAVRIKCVSNLKQVGLAFRIWEGDNGDRYPMSVYTNAAGEQLFASAALAYRYYQVMSNELNNPSVLICPSDENRISATNFGTSFSSSNISYFIGLDADERFPQLFMAGDMNLTNGHPLKNGVMKVSPKHPASWTGERHQYQGNIGMADGSVQEWGTGELHKYIQETNLTERLLLPGDGATK